jgi:hypothetical protein
MSDPVFDDPVPPPAPAQADSAGPAGTTQADLARAAGPQETVASPAETGQPASRLSRFSFGALLAFTYRSETNSSQLLATPVLQGRFDITPRIASDIEWGFAAEGDSQGHSARSGNPWIRGWYRDDSDQLSWRAGAGVSLPLATVNIGTDGRTQRALYNQAAATWGLWDEWRWTPGRLAVPFLAAASYRHTPQVASTAEIGLAPVFGVRNGEGGTDLLAQVALGARLSVSHSLLICPRLQGVLLPSASVDRLQTAAGLRVEWTPGQRRFFLGVLVNLDEPLGFGRGTRSWGIHLGKELGL